MDVVSSVGAVVALVFNLARAIKATKDICDRYRDAASTMQKVLVELETLHGALQELVNLMMYDAGALTSRWDTNRTLPVTFAKATTNFEATIKALLKDLEMMTSQASKKSARIKYLWNDSRMQEHLVQLRGQTGALQLLLTVMQT